MREAALWYLMITVALMGLLTFVVALQAVTGVVRRRRLHRPVAPGRHGHRGQVTQTV